MALAKFHRQCAKNVSGNMNLFLTDAANVLQVTVTGGEVSDIVMTGAGAFYEIQADQNSIRRRQDSTRANKSFTNHTHNIEFNCSKPSTLLNVLNDALDDAQPCGLIAILMDSNGQGWLIGWSQSEGAKRPLYLEANTLDSGAGVTDTGQKHQINLQGANDENDLPMDATINTYISGSIAAGADLTFTP